MTEPPTSSDTGDPPAPQPWSDAGRRAARDHRERTAPRRVWLGRFNDRLTDIVIDAVEDERQVGNVLTVILRRVLWPVLLMGGVTIVRAITGRTRWTDGELAAGLVLSIMIGLSAAALWTKIRGDDPDPVEPPDPYGPAQERFGFPVLWRSKARHSDDGPPPN